MRIECHQFPKNNRKTYISLLLSLLLCRFTSSCNSIIHTFVEEKIMLENSEKRIKLLKKAFTEKQIEKLVELRSSKLNMHYSKKISKLYVRRG